ncbi:MAG: CRISPR-associated helicase Cas3' [Chloroflexi bacterium]|nr:CRISPR-associated helicase Cas3' [Chloroflexota bacterium]
MEVSNEALTFWAKTDRSREQYPPGAYHPLICHLIDVAVVTRELWDAVLSDAVRGRIARSLGMDGEVDAARTWVAFWAGLHDLGKASPKFQLRLRDDEGKQAAIQRLQRANLVLPATATDQRSLEMYPAPHGLVSAKELERILAVPFGVQESLARQLGVVTGGHHGVFPRSQQLNALRGVAPGLSGDWKGGRSWEEARLRLARDLAAAIGLASGGPRPEALDNPTAMFLAGLISVADWIGSNTKHFRFVVDDPTNPPRDIPPGYHAIAQLRAKEALEKLHWTGWRPSAERKSFAELFPKLKDSINPLQRTVEEVAETLKGPGLVIIEAPMGEGKTEAAMYLADHWTAADEQRGMYFALPTQATSDQMFGRVRDFLAARYNDNTVNLQLLHGHAALSGAFAALRKRADAPYEPQGVEGDEGYDKAPAGVIAGEWFTYRKRGLLAPFGVGTIDQALLAVLQTPHVFVRLFGLAHKTVIIDEVHAYDAYMTTLLERLLEWLGALNCSVALLSATLPPARRDDLLAAYAKGANRSDAAVIPAVRYPRVTWIAPGGAGSRTVAVSERSTKTVRIVWADGRVPAEGEDFPLGRDLAEALKDGGCAAVICNTVGRAQEVYRALKRWFPDDANDGHPVVDLLHSRFLHDGRMKRQERALVRFGKKGNCVDLSGGGEPASVKRPHKAVLVATQIIEQSLDLDFDLMVTDLAPADLVLQRIGRLHRHLREPDDDPRPEGLREPAVWICRPDMNEDRSVPQFGRAQTAVYDEHVLLRSWLALQGKEDFRIPGPAESSSEKAIGVEALIEAVYGEAECPAKASDALRAMWNDTLAKLKRKKRDYEGKANDHSILGPEEGLDVTLEQRNLELEEENPKIHETLQALTRLGDPTVAVVVLSHAEAEGFDERRTPDRDEAIGHLARSVSISHRGIVKGLPKEGPSGWSKQPLLRHHRQVALDGDGRTAVNGIPLRLDPELGLLIGKGD